MGKDQRSIGRLGIAAEGFAELSLPELSSRFLNHCLQRQLDEMFVKSALETLKSEINAAICETAEV